MALYTDLPVFKAGYDLFLMLFAVTKDFGKEYKYTLGERIKNETIEMTINIYRANSVEQKTIPIQKAREQIETIRLLVRMSYDIKQINMKRMIDLNEKIENISKQLAGWQKAVKK